MSKPKLTYFDFAGSRGEECRIALFVAGIDFEDDRISGTWPELKASTPFGSLPVLEMESKGHIGESNAILTMIGRGHDLHPSDLFEAARHEAILSASEHLRILVSATMTSTDEEKKTARGALVEGALPQFGRSVEAQIGDGPFMAGSELNVVDIKLYMILRWFVTGGVDHVPATVFSDYPKLNRLFDAVKDHPKVSEWVSRQ